MSEYLSPQEATTVYKLEKNETLSPFGEKLAKHGIAAIEMPLSSSDFQTLSEGFAVCINEHPDVLRSLGQKIDHRYGSEVGYTRKEKKLNERTGMQTADPKHYFHFSESVRSEWREKLRRGPKELQAFIEDGYEIHDALIGLAKHHISELEPSHPNISKLYFPRGDSFSFLRLLRYDGYEPTQHMGEVAKPHFDIGGVTIQAYAGAPGFWAAKDGVDGKRTYYDTHEGEAFAFLGKGHEKIYGTDDTLKPLWHGVDRIVETGVAFVPERTAVILFVDAPEVDYHIRASDTLPQLGRQALGNR